MSQELKELVEATISFVKKELANAEGGHDWWHTLRVYNIAICIAKEENANLTIVSLAALLHDIADSKFNDGDEEKGPNIAHDFLVQQAVDFEIIDKVVSIIRNMSFKNSFDFNIQESMEMNIVSDADKLDAMGAIGIARTFNYGGHIGTEIYNPDIKPIIHKSKNEYKSSKGPTVNHFYEKLLLLKNMMKTKTGMTMAKNRHDYMETFLEQFYNEWNGLR